MGGIQLKAHMDGLLMKQWVHWSVLDRKCILYIKSNFNSTSTKLLKWKYSIYATRWALKKDPSLGLIFMIFSLSVLSFPYVSIKWAACRREYMTSQPSHHALVMVAPTEQWTSQAFQDKKYSDTTDFCEAFAVTLELSFPFSLKVKLAFGWSS